MFVAKIVVASCRYIRSCSVLSLKDEVEVDIANFSGYANSCSFNCLSLVRLFLDPVFSSDISSKIFKKIFLYSFFALFFTRSFRLFVRKLITRSLFPLLFPSWSLLSLAVFRAGFVFTGFSEHGRPVFVVVFVEKQTASLQNEWFVPVESFSYKILFSSYLCRSRSWNFIFARLGRHASKYCLRRHIANVTG